MPSAQYPFVRRQYADGRIDKSGSTYLPVRIINPSTGLFQETWCLVDTGADSCLLPRELAVGLGHDLKGAGVKSSVSSGIEQTAVITYKHTFRLELLSIDLKRVVWRSRPMEIDCAESNPPALLGVENFLRRFRLTIDYPKEVMRLRW